MQQRHRIALLLAVLLLPALLSGCAKQADMDDIAVLQAAIDEIRLQNYELKQQVAALEQRLNGTAAIPAAAEPATEPAVPAAETPATATPVPPNLFTKTADEICSGLLKDGMPVRTFFRYTAADDPDGLLGTAGGYSSRADFQDTGVTDARGIVEVFPDATSAALRKSTLENAMNAHQLETENIFRYENVLLRLPAAFSDEQALAYEESLRRVLGVAG